MTLSTEAIIGVIGLLVASIPIGLSITKSWPLWKRRCRVEAGEGCSECRLLPLYNAPDKPVNRHLSIPTELSMGHGEAGSSASVPRVSLTRPPLSRKRGPFVDCRIH
ncbi:hypothetical protein BJX61DRAFT_518702, partial [Aspergillus egyptiacus]